MGVVPSGLQWWIENLGRRRIVQILMQLRFELADVIEIFLSILFVLAVVTVIGHGLWVAAASILRSLFGSKKKRRASPNKFLSPVNMQPSPNPNDDFVAYCRMLDGMVFDGLLSRDQADELRQTASTFVKSRAKQSAPQFTTNQDAKTQIASSEKTVDFAPFHKRIQSSATVKGRSLERHPLDAPVTTPSPEPKVSTPRQSIATVIQSFLIDHNIRWGEIIAGILVIACSIGLVISLWKPITATHRVVPTLLFVGADMAIFAAGLYTMRRWKLRHTSRAVLIIATMLVPLCILAGLAAAGVGQDSVSLTDPITVCSLAFGGLFCSWMIWQACVALVGRPSAFGLALSVVAASLSLPLLPVMSRWLDDQAGWFLLCPSVFVSVCLAWQQRLIFWRKCRR